MERFEKIDLLLIPIYSKKNANIRACVKRRKCLLPWLISYSRVLQMNCKFLLQSLQQTIRRFVTLYVPKVWESCAVWSDFWHLIKRKIQRVCHVWLTDWNPLNTVYLSCIWWAGFLMNFTRHEISPIKYFFLCHILKLCHHNSIEVKEQRDELIIARGINE